MRPALFIRALSARILWANVLFIFFVSIALADLRAQPSQVIDSLERTVASYQPGERAFALYTLVSYYQRSDRAKTSQFRNQSFTLIKNPNYRARTYAQIVEGIFASGIGNLDSSEYWFNTAREAALKENDSQTLAIVYSSLGRTLVSAGKAEAAVSNLLAGLRIADNDPDQSLAMKMRINLTWAYLELKRYHDGVNFGRQSLARMDSSLKWMALYLYNNIAVCYGALNRLDSARYFVEMGIRDAELNHDNQSLANGHFILGNIYANAGRNDLAILEYEKAKPFREKVGNPLFIVSDLYTLSSMYQKTGEFAKGVQTGLEALAVAKQHHLMLKFENTYQVLAMNYEGLRNYQKASEYYQLWAAAKDSVYQRANSQAIADMETKYETEKKETQIALQDATIIMQETKIERNYILITALAIGVALVVVILFLIRSRLRRKQEVLRKEYELSVQETFISATLQSQENERKRFAQDLHDGMGQLISALRFIILGQTNGKAATTDDRLAKADFLLNDMHREIRDVAFGLMPQVLIKQGLVPAIHEMAGRINSTGQVKVAVKTFDMPDRLTELQEISIYRIIQEWVNNVMKYAGATSVEIQLVTHENEITLTIEDNGNGFDRTTLDYSVGNGWKNINSRLHIMKGTVDVDTQIGRKGTTLVVIVPREKVLARK
jgi:two-component system NarL family sensor kinase